MEDDVASRSRGPDGGDVTEIRVDEADAGRTIEIRRRALRQIVETHDGVSFGEEAAGQVRTDEPRSAGDERSHPSLSRAVGRPPAKHTGNPARLQRVVLPETRPMVSCESRTDRVGFARPSG